MLRSFLDELFFYSYEVDFMQALEHGSFPFCTLFYVLFHSNIPTQVKIFAQNIYSPVRIEFSRSLFIILQNKPSEIDISIKKTTPKLIKKKGGGERRKALRKKPVIFI
jgi:hypothetical protein